MLSRAHRIVDPLDYKRVVRRGRRATGSFMVVYAYPVPENDGEPVVAPRAGFVVAKTVGGAVIRNRVKRRLRAATAPLLMDMRGDIVVRALPAAASATFAQLSAELARLVGGAERR